ncbi:hypothetical protein, conserved [Eimeria acervulina]|uniref:Transmembrane protein n=1 Tax=Eimeria acervulina TaxID=5801 RepID=U6GA78_EIMAC|nr:hypothetical protein, conserved [Eimeria acervulina]CDI77171.1 hypothetical protein, conserved [Eimeria acervulina]
MFRAPAVAAAAAYLTISVLEGASAGHPHGQEVPFQPVIEHGVGNGKVHRHIEPTQLRPTFALIRSLFGGGLLMALCLGFFFLLRSTRSFALFQKGVKEEGRRRASEEAQTGDDGREDEEGKTARAGGQGAALDAQGSIVNEADTLKAIDYPPADDPVTLGLQEVQSRIGQMETVLKWIAEAEESGRSVDSTGESLGHRLRLGFQYRQKNRNAEFEPSVPEEQVSKFKSLVGEIEQTLGRHYGRGR